MKTIRKNLTILSLCIIGILMFSIVIGLFIFLNVSAFSNEWIWGGTILFCFICVTWFLKQYVDWQHGGVLFLVSTAFLGAMVDVRGNPLLNEPIKLIYQNKGNLQIITKVTNINGTTGINYYFYIVNHARQIVQKIPTLTIIVFRFLEYLMVYTIILSILVPLFKMIRKK